MEMKSNHKEYTRPCPALGFPWVQGKDGAQPHRYPAAPILGLLQDPADTSAHASAQRLHLCNVCLETLEINDQKKESIWEIKALC